MRLRKENVERVAESEEQIRKWKHQGFQEVSDPEEITVAPSENSLSELNLTELNLTELKALAKKNGIAGVGSLTKEELLAVLKDVVV